MSTIHFRKLHDFILMLVILATVLLLVVPPYGLLSGFCDDSLYLLMALWGELLYMALVIFVRAVRSEREEYCNISRAMRRDESDGFEGMSF